MCFFLHGQKNNDLNSVILVGLRQLESHSFDHYSNSNNISMKIITKMSDK